MPRPPRKTSSEESRAAWPRVRVPTAPHRDEEIVDREVDTLMSHMESKSKVSRWEVRKKVSTKTMWYNTLDDG